MASDLFGADDNRGVPPILGPEYFADSEPDQESERTATPVADTESEPSVVYLPCQRPMRSGERDSTLQLRRTDQGEFALPVFTSVDNLVTCCGEQQAWISINTTDLDGIAAQAGADGIAVDTPMPGDEQQSEEHS